MDQFHDMKILEEELVKKITDPFFKEADQVDIVLRYVMHYLYQVGTKVEKFSTGRYKITTPKEILTVTIDRKLL